MSEKYTIPSGPIFNERHIIAGEAWGLDLFKGDNPDKPYYWAVALDRANIFQLGDAATRDEAVSAMQTAMRELLDDPRAD